MKKEREWFNMKMMVLLSNGFEEVEAVAPVDILKRAGVVVDIYSTTGHDILKGAHNIDFIADNAYELFTEAECDADNNEPTVY